MIILVIISFNTYSIYILYKKKFKKDLKLPTFRRCRLFFIYLAFESISFVSNFNANLISIHTIILSKNSTPRDIINMMSQNIEPLDNIMVTWYILSCRDCDVIDIYCNTRYFLKKSGMSKDPWISHILPQYLAPFIDNNIN